MVGHFIVTAMILVPNFIKEVTCNFTKKKLYPFHKNVIND